MDTPPRSGSHPSDRSSLQKRRTLSACGCPTGIEEEFNEFGGGATPKMMMILPACCCGERTCDLSRELSSWSRASHREEGKGRSLPTSTRFGRQGALRASHLGKSTLRIRGEGSWAVQSRLKRTAHWDVIALLYPCHFARSFRASSCFSSPGIRRWSSPSAPSSEGDLSSPPSACERAPPHLCTVGVDYCVILTKVTPLDLSSPPEQHGQASGEAGRCARHQRPLRWWRLRAD